MNSELIIIGGGPAGMAAATEATRQGIETTLIDEQASPGGQIYRSIENTPPDKRRVLGPDYEKGEALVQGFRASSLNYLPNTSVWSINAQRSIGIVSEGRAQRIQAQHIIIANGAIERPVPFAGWTLPGVMNVGAAQILLKSSSMVASDGVVIAGTGPLLLLLAWQYLNAGVAVKAILEVAPKINLAYAMPAFCRALLSPGYLLKGVNYQLALRRAGVPIIYGVSDLKALGNGRVEQVQCKHWSGDLCFDTNSLLIHFGVIPNTQLSSAAGCAHHWNESQQCWQPTTDRWGNSSLSGIAMAGDGATIRGAIAAAMTGRIAAFNAAVSLGKLDPTSRDQLAKDVFKQLNKDTHIRPFLERLHRLPTALLAQPEDDVVVCRCEEITARQIRQAVADGHTDANQVKFLTRCGMGACLGQQCGQSVAHIVAHQSSKPIAQIKPYRARPPLKPLTIGQLSELS